MQKQSDTHTSPASSLSRRNLLKHGLTGLAAGFAATFIPGSVTALAQATNGELFTSKKILIVYFSHTGVTREVAHQIQNQIGGDLVEVRPVKPYPEDDQEVHDIAKEEQDMEARPAFTADLPDLASYDLVVFGYPLWWYSLPMPLYTFLETYDLSGKTILPFCTHKGSRFGYSLDDLQLLCRQSTITDGLELRGGDIRNVQSEWARKRTTAWLQRQSAKV